MLFGFCRLLLLAADDVPVADAVHRELPLGTAHLEPPAEEILHHVAVAEHRSVPGAVCSVD